MNETKPNDTSLVAQLENLIRDLIRHREQEHFEREQAQSAEQEKVRRLLLELLELSDAYERVFASIGEKENAADSQTRIWLGNFRSVYRRLHRLLRDWEVVPIEARECQADPYLHHVVETVAQADRPEGTIVEEVRRGYLWAGKLLRVAEVVAVKKEAAGS